MNRKPTRQQAVEAIATLLDYASHENASTARLNPEFQDLADRITDDAELLAALANMVRSGKLKAARKIARRWDPQLRDQVPSNLWTNL